MCASPSVAMGACWSICHRCLQPIDSVLKTSDGGLPDGKQYSLLVSPGRQRSGTRQLLNHAENLWITRKTPDRLCLFLR